jgi:predicted nucleic acid-binding protein
LPGEVLYLDSSALVKLVVAEPESEQVAGLIGDWAVAASSVVARVEVTLVARRRGGRVVAQAGRVLAAVDLVPLEEAVLDAAHGLDPGLRALDAIHVGSAMSVGDDLGAMLTFDRRQRAAAVAGGIAVLP